VYFNLAQLCIEQVDNARAVFLYETNLKAILMYKKKKKEKEQNDQHQHQVAVTTDPPPPLHLKHWDILRILHISG